jgi:cold shock CspA family protein
MKYPGRIPITSNGGWAVNANHARTAIAPIVTLRDVRARELANKLVRDEIEKICTFFPRIMACRVMVESPHRHHILGSQYKIRIDLTMPGGEIVITHQPSLHSRAERLGEARFLKQLELNRAHRRLRQAIGDAFKVAGRRLQDYARRRRGSVKTHERLPAGHVSRLFKKKGYGFIDAEDGRDIYFHENAVLNGAFKKLTIGTTVRFAEEQGEKGPQASTVQAATGARKLKLMNYGRRS